MSNKKRRNQMSGYKDSSYLNEGVTEMIIGFTGFLITVSFRNSYYHNLEDSRKIKNAELTPIKDLELGQFVKIKGKSFSPSPLVSPWKNVLCSKYLYLKGKKFEQMTKTKQVTENTNSQTTNLSASGSYISSGTSIGNQNKNETTEEKEIWTQGRDIEITKKEIVDLYIKDDKGDTILLYNPDQAQDFKLCEIHKEYHPYKVTEIKDTSKRYLGDFEEEYAFVVDQPFTVYGKVTTIEGQKVIRKTNDSPYLITNRSQEEILEELESQNQGLWWGSMVFGVITTGILVRGGYVLYHYFKDQ